MNLDLKIINPLVASKWDESVLSKKTYSFFHSSSWARVLLESYKYKPLYFVLKEKNELGALLPLMEVNSLFTGKRGVSLPFSDHCDPIIDVDISFKDFLGQILEYGKNSNWRYFEIRVGQEFLQDVLPFSCFYSHTLDLSQDEDKIFAKFRDSTQRNVKKALRKGVKANIFKSLESINKFYRLHCITRKTHGLPPQPYHFFKNIYDFIILRDFGFVVLASHDKKVIAGAVFFSIGKKAFYKYGAMDRTYQHLRPSNLVMWEGIKWYCKNGYKTMNFGRTDMEDEGLRQYKEGWGTKESILKYYRFNMKKGDAIKTSSGRSKIQNKVLSKMPISLLKLIGSLSYKHMG
jgi:hypothetical protein